MQTANLAIEGMSCGGCVQGVTKVLGKLPGVTVQRVLVGSADVSFDPQQIAVGDITRALTAAGYPARLQEEPAA
jgi:copper chaperone